MIMKKTYINPTMDVVVLKMSNVLLAGSGGVGNGSTLGLSFDEDDISFARGGDFTFEDDAFDFGTEESISNFE